MINRLVNTIALLTLMSILSTGCLERIDADIKLNSNVNDQNQKWEYLGSFGGNATLIKDNSDPYKRLYDDGTFRMISGICVTADEVWVTDMAISRIQIFDHDGNYIRSIGSGIPIPETLISEMDLYLERFPETPEDKPDVVWQEREEALPWCDDHRNLFKASDVAVMEDGYVIADQARSSLNHNTGLRLPRLAKFGFDGSMVVLDSTSASYAEYLALDGDKLVVSDTIANALWLAEVTDQVKWPHNIIGKPIQVMDYLKVMHTRQDMEDFIISWRTIRNSSNKAGLHGDLGGVACALDKAISCDTYLNRLQVFEMRREPARYWGQLIRVIPAKKKDGSTRFVCPADIDIDDNADIFILDIERNEVAILNSVFDRIGSFGRNTMSDPHSIDVSDDGQLCFITDRLTNKVHRYGRVD